MGKLPPWTSIRPAVGLITVAASGRFWAGCMSRIVAEGCGLSGSESGSGAGGSSEGVITSGAAGGSDISS